MKLNVSLKNNRGGKKQTSDNTRIMVELQYKNKIVGEIGLYSIVDDKVEGYNVIWKDPDRNNAFPSGEILKSVEKGKKQKGEIKCWYCGKTRINVFPVDETGKYCPDCNTNQ